MQKSGNLFGLFPFLELGPVQTAQGALGVRAGGSLRLMAASNGSRFLEMGPANQDWDSQLITVIYWA